MYDFIKIQYQMGTIDAKQVKSYVPHWITEEQAKEILTLK